MLDRLLNAGFRVPMVAVLGVLVVVTLSLFAFQPMGEEPFPGKPQYPTTTMASPSPRGNIRKEGTGNGETTPSPCAVISPAPAASPSKPPSCPSPKSCSTGKVSVPQWSLLDDESTGNLAQNAHALHWPLVAEVPRPWAEKQWEVVDGVTGFVPVLGDREAMWSELCTTLLPVEGGLIRRNGVGVGEVSARERHNLALRWSCGWGGEKVCPRQSLRRVHTDICVALSGSVAAGDFYKRNSVQDRACDECGVRNIAAVMLGVDPVEQANVESCPGGLHGDKDGVAIVGFGNAERTLVVLREWADNLGVPRAIGAEEVLSEVLDQHTHLGEAEFGESIRQWMKTKLGIELSATKEPKIGCKKSGLHAVGKIVAVIDPSLARDDLKIIALLRLLEQRVCPEVLLVRSDHLAKSCETCATFTLLASFLTSKHPSGLPSPLSPPSFPEISPLSRPAHPAWYRSYFHSVTNGDQWGASVVEMFPRMAMLRSRCHPTPGQNPICSARSLPPRDPKRPLERFIHIHKAGGTSIRDMARKANENIPSGSGNGKTGAIVEHVEKLDGSNRPTLALPIQCDAVRKEMASNHYTMLAVEVPVEEEWCDEMRYSVIWRDPFEHFESNWVFHSLDPLVIDRYARVGDMGFPYSPSQLVAMRKELGPKQNNGFYDHIPKIFADNRFFLARGVMVDNYQIRSVLGWSTFNLPYGSIEDVHVERMKALVRRMCVAAVTDALDVAGFGIQASKGWDLPLKEVPHSRTSGHKGTWPPSDAPTSLIRDLQILNRFDLDVYDYIRAVSPRSRLERRQ